VRPLLLVAVLGTTALMLRIFVAAFVGARF
jgi:hypothetical protein